LPAATRDPAAAVHEISMFPRTTRSADRLGLVHSRGQVPSGERAASMRRREHAMRNRAGRPRESRTEAPQ